MSAYVEAKHAEAQRRRADLLAQVELVVHARRMVPAVAA